MNQEERRDSLFILLTFLTIILQASYTFSSLSYPNTHIGTNQLHILSRVFIILLMPICWLAALIIKNNIKLPLFHSVASSINLKGYLAVSVFISIAASVLFVSLRNQFLNRDGLGLLEKIPLGVTRSGALVTHDEMLELYIHSRFWYYANQIIGFSVRQSYQALSSVAGGIAIFLMLVLLRVLKPKSRMIFILLLLCGGFMQLFFGDVENYTLVSVLIILYFLSSTAYIKGRISLVLPSIVLALAISFHLLAGWLLPSLGYLYILSLKNREYRQIILAALAFACLIIGVLSFFHFNGLPIARLFTDSHVSGQGGDYDRYINKLDPVYFAQLGSLALLLYPGILLLPISVFLMAKNVTPINIFFAICAVGMVAFVLVWRAQLGILQDWNLFAPAFLTIAIFVAFNMSSLNKHVSVPIMAFALVAGVHSLSWIVSNHLYIR